MDSNTTTHRAQQIARRDSYSVRKIWRVYEESGEVLFTGRYLGDNRANIAADPEGEELPYRVWVRPDGTGYVTSGW